MTNIPDRHIEAKFRLVADSLNNGTSSFLDFYLLEDSIKRDLFFLRIRARYAVLALFSNNKLSCNDDSFVLDGNKFETLDEVERALDLKAFW